MEIKKIGSQPSAKGPGDWFTGTVRIDPLFLANAPARAAGNSVHLSLVQELHGTLIRLVKHLLLQPVAAGYSVKVGRLKKSIR